MMKSGLQDMATRCIHAGELEDAHGAPHTPLYDTTTFRFASTSDLLEVVDGKRDGYLYTRYGMNPTIRSLEAKMAVIDDAEASMVFSSGMAALSSLFMAYGHRGIVSIGDTYGGTLELLGNQLPALGFRTAQLDAGAYEKLESLLASGIRLVFFETPTNPVLEIVDIRAVARLAHRYDALVAIDNTFASPVNQKPLALGADIVMQSATKYLGGHSDLTAGVLSASTALLKPVVPWRKNLGQMLAPEVAHKLARSLATLTLRVEKQNANAQAVAEFLSRHEKVAKVFYPGLPSHPQHALAASQMSGFGGMVTFEYNGSGEDASKVVERLKVISLAPSLGGVESLVTQPFTTSHRDMSPEERGRRGISDAMIRLSIGIESAVDLIEDLKAALDG